MKNNQVSLKTREQIKEERKDKGFCQCHECVEREYESLHMWDTIKKEVLPKAK